MRQQLKQQLSQPQQLTYASYTPSASSNSFMQSSYGAPNPASSRTSAGGNSGGSSGGYFGSTLNTSSLFSPALPLHGILDPQLPVILEEPMPLLEPLNSSSLLAYNPSADLFGSAGDALMSLHAAASSMPAPSSSGSAMFTGGDSHSQWDSWSQDDSEITGASDEDLNKGVGQEAGEKKKRKRGRKRKLASQLTRDELLKVREINRVAAQRHRQIAKSKKVAEQRDFDTVLERNIQLKQTATDITKELETLRRLVVEMYAPGGPRHLPIHV